MDVHVFDELPDKVIVDDNRTWELLKDNYPEQFNYNMLLGPDETLDVHVATDDGIEISY